MPPKPKILKLPLPRFRSLQTRIMVVFLGLLLTLQIAGYTLLQGAISWHTVRHAQHELAVGERVFARGLAQNGQRLEQAARAVTNDFALREALATGDQRSGVPVLRRQTGRSTTDFALLLGNDGRLVAAAGSDHSIPETVMRRVASAKHAESVVGIGMFGERAYQFIVVPVRPSRPMGWLVLGSALDERLVVDLAGLSGLEVSVVSWDAAGGWRVLASSRRSEARQAPSPAVRHLAFDSAGEMRVAQDSQFQRLALPLDTQHSVVVGAVLERSLEEAAAPFRRLQSLLLALSAIGLVLAACGSVLMVSRITGPLRTLAAAARKVEKGEYEHRVASDGEDEISDLASAFNHMCGGIALREQRIGELAYSDPLTRLPNRALFNDRIAQAVNAAQRSRGRLAVLILDLDRFKHVNDTLGHYRGDILLREVADSLLRALQRRSDTIARLGGDEFAVLLPTGDVGDAEVVARRVIEVLAARFTIDGHVVDVGASIGIAMYPEHGADADTLMRHADVAMYAAKRARTGFEVYDAQIDQETPARLSLLGELRHAVEHDQLAVWYQPKVTLSGDSPNAAEALIRWIHPERGVITPDMFIPFAEQTGYIRAVTRYVLDKVFRQSVAWRARGMHLRVSVNISTRDLHNPEFPREVAQLATAVGAKPEWICLEITESAVMENPAHALAVLQRLDAMGIALSIDDFGTGYSSLAYLKRLPVRELKIDRSFVVGLVRDSADAAIVRATIDLAHHLGLAVTAEGVDNGRALSVLRKLGCDMAQGYHISPPLRADDFRRWLEDVPIASVSNPIRILQ